MKRLKIILQSNLFLLILIIATIVIITIRILTPSKTYYTPKDNKVIGTIEKITLVLFSTLMLIISVILCLTIFGWIDTADIGNVLNIAISNNV